MQSFQIGTHPKWMLWGMSFNSDTLTMTWLVSAILIAIAIFVRLQLSRKPGKTQAAVELSMEALLGLVNERLGERGRKYLPLAATLFLFILFSNWLGMLPFDLKAPTADLNTTAGLAVLVILLVQVFGVIEKGPIKYLHRFVEPYFLFLPLNIIEEVAKPFSLAVRLFCNIFSKEIILLILTALTVFPIIYPIPILALGIFIGAIQAYVFTLLSVFYISMAIEGH